MSKYFGLNDFLILAGVAAITVGFWMTCPSIIPFFYGVGLLALGIYRSR